MINTKFLNKFTYVSIFTFILFTFIRLYYLILNLNNPILSNLGYISHMKLIFVLISLLLNIVILILGVNLTYFLISLLNKKLNEFQLTNENKNILKYFCYISFSIPLTLNSIFLIIYMNIFNTSKVFFNINTLIVSILISFIIYIFLKFFNTKKICIYIPILLFILNVAFLFN